MIRTSETIYAQATPPGRSAISVLRLSGPGVRAALRRLSIDLPPARVASLRILRDPTGEALDRALVIWMPGPGSFTGEDVAELHVHGGLAVRTGVLRTLGEMGLRPAEPGEFTRRAFAAGRMDLSEVEGLADLIDAETDMQRRQALRQLDGALSRRVAEWRDRLVEACSLLEAGLDFSDEEDVGSETSGRALDAAADIARQVRAALAGARRGERIRDGVTVVIAGPPNAGKSTLLNALAARDVAIVSPVPGTTRDAIEARCDLDGVAVTFVDTAGLRDTADAIELEGISRTRRRAADAELVLWLDPLDAPVEPPADLGPSLLRVRTKLDLVRLPHGDDLAISAERGDGLDHLVTAVRRHIDAAMGAQGDALITRERHRLALADVADSLERARVGHAAGHDELAAEDLRLALRALGRITGQVDVEEILDGVFGQFCIGK